MCRHSTTNSAVSKPLSPPHGDALLAWHVLQHHQRRNLLRPPVGLRKLRIHDKSVAVLSYSQV
jgi:hypothetical protein